MPHRRPPASAHLAAAGMTVAFGLSFVATKYALRGFQPLLIALIRFAAAGGLLWVLWRLRRPPERAAAGELRRLAALGFISLTVYFCFENIGLSYTSASKAAVLIAAIPIFVAGLNLFTLHERVGAREWAGVVLSFAGVVALVSLAGGSGGGTLLGDLLVLGAAFSAAVGTVMARGMLITRPALYVTAYQNLFGALFMLPLALGEALLVGVRRPTAGAAGGLVYLVLGCSVLGYLLLNYAFRFIEASRLSVYINLLPVVGVAFAHLLLGERFTPAQAGAAAVIVAGVWLANSGAAAVRSPSAG